MILITRESQAICNSVLREHQSGEINGCYTQSRLPVSLMYSDYSHDVNNAIAFEKQVKGWSRRKKEALMKSDWHKLKLFSKNYTEFGNRIKNNRHPSSGSG